MTNMTDFDKMLADSNAHLNRMKKTNRWVLGVAWVLASAVPFFLLLEDSSPAGVAGAALFAGLLSLPIMALHTVCLDSEQSYEQQIYRMRINQGRSRGSRR